MRQISWGLTGFAFFILQGLPLTAQQSSIDLLDKDLADLKQQHQEASAQTLANFFAQLDQARNSPDIAIDLYKKAGGTLPPETEVKSHYDHETPHERETREQQDADKLVNLAVIAQIHCGLMRFGGLFVTSPDDKTVHDDWINWIKNIPQTYLQIKDDGIREVRDFRKLSIKDSAISKYLGFQNWGDKQQGTWSVKDIPRLYRSEILDPLRTTPSPSTLAAWDVYISLKNADQPDTDKWNQVEYPALGFDRACDDYAVTPTMDKLQTVIQIIKANPTLPKIDDMIAHAHDLIADFRTRHGGAPVAASTNSAPTAPAADPNVSVTTQGDMTIVTTNHPSTNAAPVAPPPASPQ